MYNFEEINKWFKWKNNKNRQSVEDMFFMYTEECGGVNNTDVLFNILYLYAIGLYVKNKSNKTYLVSNSIRLGTQLTHSLKYINDNRDKDVDKCLNSLAAVYFSYGNLTVMWPGGNTLKGNGNNGYYDNPDLFFKKNEKWFLILNKFEYAFLDCFRERIKDTKYKNLQTFVDSFENLDSYEEYINGIVEIINDRTKKIKKYLKAKKIDFDQ